MHIRTVLCPVDFSGLDPIEIGVATEVCRAFGATLLLQHNLAAAQPGFSRAWEWAKAHEGREVQIPEAERRLQALVRKWPPGRARRRSLRAPWQVVLSMANELDVDLIVLGSHGWSTDHASVTERLVQSRRARCCVPGGCRTSVRSACGRRAARRRSGLVPTDLTRDSSAVAYACELGRRLPLRLDSARGTGDPGDATVDHAEAVRRPRACRHGRPRWRTCASARRWRPSSRTRTRRRLRSPCSASTRIRSCAVSSAIRRVPSCRCDVRSGVPGRAGR
jgi:nucleotide-binding universal stress UspA family protein